MLTKKLRNWNLTAVDERIIQVLESLVMEDYFSFKSTETNPNSVPAHMTLIHGGDRADVLSVNVGDASYCVKNFHDSRPRAKLRNKLGLSKAGRAFSNGLKLQQLDLPVPHTLGLAVCRGGSPCLLVTELLGTGLTLRDLFWGDKMDKQELQRQSDQLTRRLTNKGVHHIDYGPRNLLYCEKKLYLIDLEDVRFHWKPNSYQWMREQFEARSLTDSSGAWRLKLGKSCNEPEN